MHISTAEEVTVFVCLQSFHETALAINILELKTICYVKVACLSLIWGKHVQVYTNNAKSVYYINRINGTEFLALCWGISMVWEWSIFHKGGLPTIHIPGKESGQVKD